ncbi:hypothetical protein T552_02778 [Pneumocystis carinii B80]|uniref:RING-type E3 ubiquitin transferase n=1 Tax=Pneumocystis carinii (strain B80) TaxID=1408658 RepID=A0A0W4ZEG4_PNEC8|nr:hypothetical protein T552_02778 [Pneumocystis carinii B80]KTW26777.1 hypothetical protein T552_02778 [Pneumocystis carinii B80]
MNPLSCQSSNIIQQRSSSFSNSSKIWQPDSDVLLCPFCKRAFSFFHRRHHCRKCGCVVCSSCSSNNWDFSRSFELKKNSNKQCDSKVLRVCDKCFMQLFEEQSQKKADGHSSLIQKTRISNDEMIECPVCLESFSMIPTLSEREIHIDKCLKNNHYTSESTLNKRRFLSYVLPSSSSLVGTECIICFEEMLPGEKIARLECLCNYHVICIKQWISVTTGRGCCPIHMLRS